MDWKSLARQANRIIQKRGGPQSVKEDAEELRAIAEERESTGQKLRDAAKAIKEPGAPPHEQSREATDQPQSPLEPPG